jgi:hypothetical protein
MNRSRAAAAAVVLGLVLSGVSGCGVSVQQEAQPLPSGALPPLAQAPSPTPTTKESTVYFVSGRGLEGVTEPIREQSAQGMMEALAAGPPIDRQADLRTLLLDPLTRQPVLAVVSQSPSGRVVLARTEGFTLLPATDQVLLVGQVVTSLAEVGVTSVIITDEAGLPIPLALPDGRVLEVPATADDYDALVVDPDL